ncbi:OmpA family protein [Acinetobacter sp. 194]|uniref:OmpA family protein n=1 Tax=Acinetobacter shaoyimingii TaxID=2715164 RepID=UPI00140CE2A3|nr:OmpA family protein [Acinetobacter shaoyimingii]NHB57072.1 OmpA family protein [Acinetobacter shaoyimingii]
MDLIQILKERVIPVVLKQDLSNQDFNQQDATITNEKQSVLSLFFPILLIILRAKPKLIESLQHNLNPRLSDLFQQDTQSKQQLIQSIQHSLPYDQVENLLDRSIAPTLNVLEDLAGSREPDDIARFLDRSRETIRGTLPIWSLPILGAMGIHYDNLKPLTDPTVKTVPVEKAHAEPEKKKGGFLLPLIALLILALIVAFLWRSCQEKNQKIDHTQVAPNADQELAFFQLSTDKSGNLDTCKARIGNPTFTQILQQDIKQLFKHPMGCEVDSSNKFRSELVDQAALPEVLKLIQGVPHINLVWTGAEISIQGPDTDTVKKLAEKIKPLVPEVNVVFQAVSSLNQQTIANEQKVIDESVRKAESALNQIDREKVQPVDIAKALNLQIINFAFSSAEIPDVNKSVLDKAAVLIKEVDNVHLKVKGYTDSVGTAEVNNKLSNLRAEAVVNYLVSKGVDKSKLTAVGYGQEQPVADNTTPEGQFKNRRIEFEVVNTETGVKREVGSNGIEKKN